MLRLTGRRFDGIERVMKWREASKFRGYRNLFATSIRRSKIKIGRVLAREPCDHRDNHLPFLFFNHQSKRLDKIIYYCAESELFNFHLSTTGVQGLIFILTFTKSSLIYPFRVYKPKKSYIISSSPTNVNSILTYFIQKRMII